MPRLRRTSPDDPGWTRRRAGKGFVYLDEHGERLSDADAQRVRDLVIPPAWQDVWITPVRERPPAGRRHRRRRPAAVPLPPGLARPARRREVRPGADVRQGAVQGAGAGARRPRAPSGMPLERACAVAVRLLDLGYFRIGNDVYADQHGSFGLTTLERRHVRKAGGTGWSSASSGKSGIEHRDRDRRPGRDRGARRDAPPARRRDQLLAWKDGRRWRSLDSRAGQRLRAGESTGARRHRQGLPDLARDRARGRRAGRDRRARGVPRRPASGRSRAR